MIQPDATHFSRESTSEFSVALNKPESFKLMYWPINAVGATSREILAYGQAKWENLAPGNWQEEKLKTPFQVVPILYIRSQNGQDLVLSESSVIEQYLAKTFGLLGDNDYEEYLIKAFHSSSAAIQSHFAQGVTWEGIEAAKTKHFEFFKSHTLKIWVETHEKHLSDNGNNGHYVGNKLSLADIRTACAIEHFALLPEAPELMEIINKSEALLKVRETVAKDPKIATWRDSELYKKLSHGSIAFFTNPFAFIKAPSN
ncbi:hypothetical protein BGX21_009378 [Mortierella sp. AD011]|nr:hypothetical protein BGX20_002161 [Mortierella sp. AD010]KAF9402632.1 hypothetical protein BGX21_009378 [Mortierella sp. AD011]